MDFFPLPLIRFLSPSVGTPEFHIFQNPYEMPMFCRGRGAPVGRAELEVQQVVAEPSGLRLVGIYKLLLGFAQDSKTAWQPWKPGGNR